LDPGLLAELSNKSYDKLKGKIYNSAALGVDFAESRQSFAMVVKASGTLISSLRHVRRGDFAGAAATLRTYVPKGVSARKSASANWLEYHFGWEPLIHDIYDAVEVINNPLKTYDLAKGRATSKDEWIEREGSHGGPFSSFRDTLWQVTHSVQQGAAVKAITNGTTHSLDQFGLLNPLTIAWELVPFSFVIDWFANVGQVLASYSDFAGMELERTFTTKIVKSSFQGTAGYDGYIPDPNPGMSWLYYKGQGVWMQRTLGLTAPVFHVNQLKLPSKTRAVTAAALLVQKFAQK